MEAASDSEWELVTEQDRTLAPLVVAAPSKDELKCSKDLSMVHNIYRGVQTSEIVDRLGQCNGNVLVVVNVLLEEIAEPLFTAKCRGSPVELAISIGAFRFRAYQKRNCNAPRHSKDGSDEHDNTDGESTTSSSSISPTR
uniref:Uncharacterized protein n=1 Tax=Peronospora matthiolae TaxID=2874970 RepID=A0AAV1U790_9STRA